MNIILNIEIFRTGQGILESRGKQSGILCWLPSLKMKFVINAFRGIYKVDRSIGYPIQFGKRLCLI